MSDPLRVPSADGRLWLEQLGVARTHAILAGDLDVLPYPLAPGWPTDDTADGLGAALAASSEDSSMPFLVVEQARSLVIGECGWKGGPGPDGRAEIGYGLAASARGRGYGSELVRTLTSWALSQPGCVAVVAEVSADNLPSRRALERAGFVVESTTPRDVWYVRTV